MIDFQKNILKNGLTVLTHADTSTPLVTFGVLYKVGSRNEDAQHTGFAHLFEHLMFGGTPNIPDYDTPLQNVGAENNAFTTNDYTFYYITLPANNLETAFWIEADRMNELAFTQESLDVQRSVVIEEFKQRCLNVPYGDSEHLVRDLSYTVHPYKWPTIGARVEHIANATLDDVKSFFYSHYAPDNAIVVVAGNIDEEKTFRLAEKWFGGISRQKIVTEIVAEPVQTARRELTVSRKVPAKKITMAYHMGGRVSADYYVTDIVTDLLANGASSRITQNLVKRDHLISDGNAYILGSVDPGLICMTATLLPGVGFDKVETALRNEMLDIINGNFSDYEIQKIKNKSEADKVYEEIDLMSKAINLALFEMIGNVDLINTESEIYNRVTRDDICTAMKRICTSENESVVFYNND
ncbi:MAG: insulinase family protein [Bacteroidales bacterium]|nr:insulinase family protein [Bacteroidales bacterium]